MKNIHIWLPAPAKLSLSDNETHIWCANLDLAASRFDILKRTLSPDEVTRAERMYFTLDRDRFIFVRGLLRTILSRYLDMAPEKLQFCYSPFGKPTLNDQSGEYKLYFNLTHSHNLSLYAVTLNRQVGIDLEYRSPIPEANQIVEQFFSAHEKAEFHGLSVEEQPGMFFRWWTCKEAFIKARGHGLAFALDRFSITMIGENSPRYVDVGDGSGKASHWSIYEITPTPDYVAALVVEGQNTELSYWQWMD